MVLEIYFQLYGSFIRDDSFDTPTDSYLVAATGTTEIVTGRTTRVGRARRKDASASTTPRRIAIGTNGTKDAR